jgi:hypothetical protein
VLTGAQWAGFCTGQVREYGLPCTHGQITQPHWLGQIARQLEERLRATSPTDRTGG